MFDEKVKGLIMRSLDSCISGVHTPLLGVYYYVDIRKCGYSNIDCTINISKGKIKVSESNGSYLFYMSLDDIHISGYRCWGDSTINLGEFDDTYVYATDYVLSELGVKYRGFIYKKYLEDCDNYSSINTYLEYVIDYASTSNLSKSTKDKLIDDAKRYAEVKVEEGKEKEKLVIDTIDGINHDVMDKYGVKGLPVLEISRNLNYYTYKPNGVNKYDKTQLGRDNRINDIIKTLRSNEDISDAFFRSMCRARDSKGVLFSLSSKRI